MKTNADGWPELEGDDASHAIGGKLGLCISIDEANRLLHEWLKTQPQVWGTLIPEDHIAGFSFARNTETTHTAYLVGIKKIGETS